MIRRPWTAAEVKRLATAYAAGVPVAAIAREFGRSVGAVVQQAHRQAVLSRAAQRREDPPLSPSERAIWRAQERAERHA